MSSSRHLRFLPVLALAAPNYSSADTVVVNPVDKAGFQAIVDSACEGDELVCLGGFYDFSAPGAVEITKGLQIVADDACDPPIFVGALTATGKWASAGDLMIPPPGLFNGNMGFGIPPGAVVDDLRMEGLHMEGFERAIYVAPGWDADATGCWVLTEPGSVTDLRLKDNHISNCSFGIMLIGGPLEDFKVQGNTIDVSNGTVALNVQGDEVPCGPIYANVQRPRDGQIEGNVLTGAPTPPMTGQRAALQIAGVEDIQVKDNTIFAHPSSTGILIRDIKAFTFGPFAGATPPFGDDGPISMGQIKNNTIYNAGFGVACVASTTLADVQIKDNTMVDSLLFDIFLANTAPGFQGSNGFVIEGNSLSGTALVADVQLSSSTVNNLVKVPEGTNVVDLGTNTVIYQ